MSENPFEGWLTPQEAEKLYGFDRNTLTQRIRDGEWDLEVHYIVDHGKRGRGGINYRINPLVFSNIDPTDKYLSVSETAELLKVPNDRLFLFLKDILSPTLLFKKVRKLKRGKYALSKIVAVQNERLTYNRSEYMTSSEVFEYLNISRQRLGQIRRDKLIHFERDPLRKLSYLYLRSDIERYKREHQRGR